MALSVEQRKRIWGYVALVCFVLTIPLSNWVIMNVGLMCRADAPCLVYVWPGLLAPSSVIVAGLALVVRDIVHELLGGKWALVAIVVGALISGLISEPSLVVASACAFFFSEFADFLVYAPLRERHLGKAVVFSGLVGSVVDSALFLTLAFGSVEYLFGQVLGKFWMSLLGGALILLWRRYFREPSRV